MLRIVENRKWWYLGSGTLVVLAVLSLLLWRLNFGIDFTGGSLLEVSFLKDVPAREEIKKVIDPVVAGATLENFGEKSIILRFAAVSEAEHERLLGELKKRFADVREERFESVGPTIGAELRSKALLAIVFVLLAIAAYVAWAFRKVSEPVASWKYGVITLLTLFHDVVIPLGVFAVLGKFGKVEVGASFIAATLTILGYSVNDTIVIFDRVRENLLKTSGRFEDIVERSMHETLARSVITSVTVLLSLVAVLIFGGESVRNFALALIIGILAGGYSSIFIASPLLVSWLNFDQKRKARRR